jgi:hypothetical protein
MQGLLPDGQYIVAVLSLRTFGFSLRIKLRAFIQLLKSKSNTVVLDFYGKYSESNTGDVYGT